MVCAEGWPRACTGRVICHPPEPKMEGCGGLPSTGTGERFAASLNLGQPQPVNYQEPDLEPASGP